MVRVLFRSTGTAAEDIAVAAYEFEAEAPDLQNRRGA
jgi:hypothetical protein